MLMLSTYILQKHLIKSTTACITEQSQKIGINGKIGVWIHNFYQNRRKCVAVNGTTSSEAQVRSGIPQGSVLGPLIFLMHISDINYEIVDSTVSCFADDTRILLGIKDEEDTEMLQNDLHKLYKWAERAVRTSV